MKYRAVIFDMDGTILDTLDDLTNAVNHCLKSHGFPLREKSEIRSFVGNGIHKLVERAVPKGTDPEKTESVYQDMLVYYQQHCDERTKPYSGIIELLKSLREKGYLTAVVSNKADAAVVALCEKYFNGLFDAAVGEKPGVDRKPAPDSVYAVLEKLGTEKDQAVYIGDSEVDIETAGNAGIDCISVTWGFRDRDILLCSGVGKIVDKPEEIEKVLLRNRT